MPMATVPVEALRETIAAWKAMCLMDSVIVKLLVHQNPSLSYESIAALVDTTKPMVLPPSIAWRYSQDVIVEEEPDDQA